LTSIYNIRERSLFLEKIFLESETAFGGGGERLLSPHSHPFGEGSSIGKKGRGVRSKFFSPEV